MHEWEQRVDRLARELLKIHLSGDSKKASQRRADLEQALVHELEEPLKRLCNRFCRSFRNLSCARHLEPEDLLQEAQIHLVSHVLPTWCKSDRTRKDPSPTFYRYAYRALVNFLNSLFRKYHRESKSMCTVSLDQAGDLILADVRPVADFNGALEAIADEGSPEEMARRMRRMPRCQKHGFRNGSPEKMARRMRREGHSLAQTREAIERHFGLKWSLSKISRVARDPGCGRRS